LRGPDQEKAQIEGNVGWGCSTSLLEGTAMEADAIAASNDHDCPVLRNEDMPEVEPALIAGDPPSGAGETALLPCPRRSRTRCWHAESFCTNPAGAQTPRRGQIAVPNFEEGEAGDC
jgi:hypothetical protein